MLPKENRLTKKSDFKLVLEKGEVIKGIMLGLAVYKPGLTSYKNGGNVPKIGFIVSNKISKKATERNRIKRLMRAVVKENLGTIAGGTRLVFLAKKTANGAKSDEIAKEAATLLAKAISFKNV